MDFEPSETERLIERTARDFAERRLSPLAAAIDERETIPTEVLRALGEIGLVGFGVPAALGGSDAGPVAFALSMMAVARGCASTAVTMGVTNMVAEVIARFGSPAQKQRYCPALSSGAMLAGSFALSEPSSGTDAASLQTTATAVTSGAGVTTATAVTGGASLTTATPVAAGTAAPGFVLRGTKAWVTSAPYAGVIVVWARTAPPDPSGASRGISCFLVEPGTVGLTIGPPERKMGLRGSHTCSLAFDDCWIPESTLLGELHRGFPIAMVALDGGRIGVSAQAIGIAEGALDDAVAYAKQRCQFGQPIADFQAIQWMLADSRTELDAARLLCLRAAAKKASGQPFTREASMAKVFATEAAGRVCDRAVQIHGGNGYVRDYPVERRLRDVRVTRIYEGTSEIQRVVVGRGLVA